MSLTRNAVWRLSPLLVVLFVLFPGLGRAAEFVDFSARTLDSGFSGGYGVELADINGDGRQDVIALSLSPARLAWYANGDWSRRLIETERDALIDVAPHDITGNGLPDLVLASEFSLADTSEGGRIQWLENPGSQAPEADWPAHDIDRIPASHRLRWADVSGTGKMALINLPIIGEGAEPPGFEGGARLTAYNIPEEPREPWGSVLLDETLEMAHGLEITDWDDDGRQDLLTASFNGVDLFRLATEGQFVQRRTLVETEEGRRPETGASEVSVGRLGQERFLATVEPWHGNEVVVYRRSDSSQGWQRRVIDDSLVDGHALATADLDNDGRAEIIAGGRGEPWALNIYRYRPAEEDWQRIRLDDSVAVSGLVVSDLSGNGFADIVAVGSDSANVRFYRNEGPGSL